MAGELHLSLLGTPRILLDNAPVTGFVSSKAQALLCYLAMTGRSHSRQMLAALLWAEMPETDARANLRVTLSNLRQLLGSYLTISRETIAFDRTSCYWLDTEDFQLLDTTTSSDSFEQRLDILRRQVELYRGDFLDGFHVRDTPVFDEWALLQRERLRQIVLRALHILVVHALEQGAYASGITYATRLLELEPWQEEAHRQLMLLLSLHGQRSVALAQYAICRRILAEELQVEPAEETTALYKRIRAAESDYATNAPTEILTLPLIGRTAEHAWLVRQYEAARRLCGMLTLVSGAHGIGKTRLIDDVLSYVENRGAYILRSHCYEFGDHLLYQPVADLLRNALSHSPEVFNRLPEVWCEALAWLVPECSVTAATKPIGLAPADGAARQRLFEAVAQLMRALVEQQPGSRPLVIVFDDLQWAERASIDLLRYLFHRLRELPIWFVGACCEEDMPAGHPARLLRHTLGKEGRLALLEVGPLAASAMNQLVVSLPNFNRGEVEQFSAYLSRESEGNPFVMTQILQDLIGKRHPIADANEYVPFGVREMVLERLGRLSPAARQILNLAATIGPYFDLALLQAAVDPDCDAERALAECYERQLIVLVANSGSERQGAIICRFGHDMIRRVITTELHPWQRRQLRRKVMLATKRAYTEHMMVLAV